MFRSGTSWWMDAWIAVSISWIVLCSVSMSPMCCGGVFLRVWGSVLGICSAIFVWMG